MVDKIDQAKPGNGFFNAEGTKLKSKRELEAADKKEAEALKEIESAAAKTSTDASIRSAFDGVSQKTAKQFNSAIQAVNTAGNDVNDGLKVVREQLDTARDLKQAIRNGDQDSAEVARKKLEKLDQRREALEGRIRENNGERAEAETRISLGNKEIASVGTQRVELESRRANNLKSEEDVERYISGLKSDRESLKQQRDSVRSARAELKSGLTEAQRQISEVRGNSISSFEEASRDVRSIARDVTEAGISSVVAAAGRAEPARVQELLKV